MWASRQDACKVVSVNAKDSGGLSRLQIFVFDLDDGKLQYLEFGSQCAIDVQRLEPNDPKKNLASRGIYQVARSNNALGLLLRGLLSRTDGEEIFECLDRKAY
jgi:hypothetical protein